MHGAQKEPERRSQEDRDQDCGVLRASGKVSGLVMAGLVVALSHHVVNRMRVVTFVRSGSRRGNLVRGSEEPVTHEDRHNQDSGGKLAGCQWNGDGCVSGQEATE